jgi:hypothetical protein
MNAIRGGSCKTGTASFIAPAVLSGARGTCRQRDFAGIASRADRLQALRPAQPTARTAAWRDLQIFSRVSLGNRESDAPEARRWRTSAGTDERLLARGHGRAVLIEMVIWLQICANSTYLGVAWCLFFHAACGTRHAAGTSDNLAGRVKPSRSDPRVPITLSWAETRLATVDQTCAKV